MIFRIARFSKYVVLLAVGAFGLAAAQAVNITGTVIDSATSQNISGALIKLIEYSTITTTSAANGTFSLTGTATLVHPDQTTPLLSGAISMNGNRLTIMPTLNGEKVSVDIFNSLGSRIYHEQAQSSQTAAIQFSRLWEAAGIYYAKVRIGSAEKTLTCSESGTAIGSSRDGAVVRALPKSTATYTLQVVKGGYVTKQVTVSSLTAAAGTIALAANKNAPVIYVPNRIFSPIDATIVQRMKDIAARGSGLRPFVFMKVGDSNSILSYQGFVNCFGGIFPGDTGSSSQTRPWPIMLDGRDYLKETIRYFRGGPIAGWCFGQPSSYSRGSVCTVVGSAAGSPLFGSAPTLIAEIDTMKPQWAIVMFGTNDMNGAQMPSCLESHEQGMRAIADTLISRGIVPIFTTGPYREDGIEYTRLGPAFTTVQRAIAQGRQFPLIDLYFALTPLPMHGMDGPGNLMHLSTKGSFEGCQFCDSTKDLNFGMSTRNLITIQMLDRIKRSFVDSGLPPDSNVARLQGNGSAASPFIIDTLPFGEMRDIRSSPNNALGHYSCSGSAAAPGKEYLYKFVLTQQKAIRVLVFDAKANAVNVNLLSALNATSCLKSGARMIETTLNAGTYYIAVDANSAGVGAEYTLAVTGCVSGDPACAQ